MKNPNTAKQDPNQDKFGLQLRHLQSVAGLPHWNFKSPTIEDLKAYDQKGRDLQADAISSSIGAAYQWLINTLFNTVSRLIDHVNKQPNSQPYQALCEHQVEAISLRRERSEPKIVECCKQLQEEKSQVICTNDLPPPLLESTLNSGTRY